MAGNETEELNDILVSSKTLEALFGVKDRMIRVLADEGIVKRSSHGKYLLIDSAKNYIAKLKVENAVSKKSTEASERTLSLDEERALHEHAKRQITEIKLQLIQGKVHKDKDVEAVMTDMFTRFREKMTALPAKLARKLEGKDKQEIQRILRKEINQALQELADYDPADFCSDEYIDLSNGEVQMTDGKNGD